MKVAHQKKNGKAIKINSYDIYMQIIDELNNRSFTSDVHKVYLFSLS